MAGKNARQNGLAATVAPDQAGVPLVKGFIEIGEKRFAVRQDVGHALQGEIKSRHTWSKDAKGSLASWGQKRFAIVKTAASVARGTQSSEKCVERSILKMSAPGHNHRLQWFGTVISTQN